VIRNAEQGYAGDACVLVFVRAPRLGEVKTRLARTLGNQAALALYRAFVADLLDTLRQCGQPVIGCCTPAAACDAVAAWMGPLAAVFPQTGADLGARMADAFERAFGGGFHRVLLVGSDLPDLPATVFETAFAALADHPAVIGPTLDGGYYLIGFRPESFLPAVFESIPWGTSEVLAETLAAFRRHGLGVYRLPVWRDIDELGDLLAFARRPWAAAASARRTRALLAGLGLAERTGRRAP
jgi:rSAM/selenodomain-associated transferase 1